MFRAPQNKASMEKFIPSEEALSRMRQKYPKQSTFVMDTMMTNNSAIGWFITGFMFGIDKELKDMGTEAVFNELGEKWKDKYDA